MDKLDTVCAEEVVDFKEVIKKLIIDFESHPSGKHRCYEIYLTTDDVGKFTRYVLVNPVLFPEDIYTATLIAGNFVDACRKLGRDPMVCGRYLRFDMPVRKAIGVVDGSSIYENGDG